ncbi:MAG: RNA polymerase sigma factor [Planctomycetota bacterium]|nr:MAG: RNA polymerase sigma factor [Planctomycetota bacterium]
MEQKPHLAHLISRHKDLGTGKEKKYLQEGRDLLAVRLRAGNHAAAAELVDKYHEQLYLFMRRLGHSCQVSEDLTQESFIQAWQHIGQLRSGRALNSWLYRIAANVSKKHIRKYRRRRLFSMEAADLPDDTEDGYDKVRHLEQVGRLKIAVAKLPVKLRQAVVLHYLQHLTISEAAEAAEVTEGTFKSRLNRALKVLRNKISSEDGELP